MSDDEPWFNKRPQMEFKWRSLLLTGPGGGMGTPPGVTWGGQCQMQGETVQDLEHRLLLMSMGGVL